MRFWIIRRIKRVLLACNYYFLTRIFVVECMAKHLHSSFKFHLFIEIPCLTRIRKEFEFNQPSPPFRVRVKIASKVDGNKEPEIMKKIISHEIPLERQAW